MERKTHELRQDKRNRELCKKIKQNDLDAETRLLVENEGLLRNLTSASEMVKAMEDAQYGGIELDDILQEGRIAMLRAAQSYDENAGAEFSSYAFAAMKNAMTDLCRKGLSAFETIICNETDCFSVGMWRQISGSSYYKENISDSGSEP